MPYRNVFAVYRVCRIGRGKAFRFNVKTDLVAKEIKINPSFSLTPLRTSHNIAVKPSCLFLVFDGIGEMKNRRHGLSTLFGAVSVISAAFQGFEVSWAFMDFVNKFVTGFKPFETSARFSGLKGEDHLDIRAR